MNKLTGNQKILVSVAAFVLIMAAIIGVLCILGSDDNQNNEEYMGYGNADNLYEGYSAESLTAPPATTSPAMNNTAIKFTEAEQAIMQAYTSGTYYLSGAIYSDGAVTPIELAMSGKNFYTTSEMEGMTLGVMYLNSKVYFINKDEKKYLDFEAVAKLMGVDMGFDMSELDSISESMDMSQYNFTDLEKTDVEINGEPGVCYRFYNEELALYFYFSNDQVRQIDFGSASGEISMSTVVYEFLPEVPDGMLSLKGLTMSTMFDFFGDEFMKEYYNSLS